MNLTQDQYNRMAQLYRNAWMIKQNGVDGLGNVPAQQRELENFILQSGYYNNFNSNSTTAVGNQASQTRFNDLNSQYRVYNTLIDPAMEAKLNLTNEQRQRLEQRYQAWLNSRNSPVRDTASDRNLPNQLSTQWSKEVDAIGAILTPEQRSTWNKIVRETREFPSSLLFPTNSKDGPKTPAIK